MTATKKLTLEEKLLEWKRCNEERLRHGREAKAFESQCEQLEADFEAELKKSEKASIIRHGFTLCWIPGRSSVSWSSEYLKVCGADKVATLKKEAAAKVGKVLSIVPPIDNG